MYMWVVPQTISLSDSTEQGSSFGSNSESIKKCINRRQPNNSILPDILV